MTSEAYAKQNQPQIENRLRARRQSAGLSQKQLAAIAGITRQAVCAIEANQYSPATSVALELGRALRCRVEDLFSLKGGGEIIEAELIGALCQDASNVRAQVTQVGDRSLVRPLNGVGELTSLFATADGVILGLEPEKNRVKVKLFKDFETVRKKIVVAGCDPAMFLAAAHLKKSDEQQLMPWLMGSSIAIDALKRGEVHIAGVHLSDEASGVWNVPDLIRRLPGLECVVVTFAHWEEGFMVSRGNPKKIRDVADLARSSVTVANRENGSGARRLLDRQLQAAGIRPVKVKGYNHELMSHLEVGSRIKAGLADVGIGIRSAASICGLDFIPLQRERYDLVIPKTHYESQAGLRAFLDIIVSKEFRDELNALGGYDTRETGKVVDWVSENRVQ
jgi:molybdate-binding protein/DNA-binding XRE family transcriptional regulator